MRRALVVVAISLATLPAAAQTSLPTGLDFPDRAMALRPTGMALQRFEWTTLTWNPPPGSPGMSGTLAKLAANTFEARVPIDSLLLEVAAGGATVWGSGGVTLASDALEVGAAFRDAPAPGWRYELGGAVAVPSVTYTTQPPPPSRTLYPTVAPRDLPRQRSAWNPQRLARDTMSVVPHARVEVDPIAEMVLGLEVDVPILVSMMDGHVDVLPQIALEAAARIERSSLVGMRGELTTYRGASVLIEPFVRIALPFHRSDAFVRVGVRIPLGPAFPFAIGGTPFGFIGGAIDAGALF